MAFIQYLTIAGINLPLPNSYDIVLSDVEADSSGQTEAGTIQRDVVRTGIVSISVSFSVTARWLSIFSGYAKRDKLNVKYFDTISLEQKEAEMYITEFRARLEKDTSYKSLWSVSFSLNEL